MTLMSSSDDGPTLRTRSGRVVDLVNPDPGDLLVSDMCWGLSLTNRFGGHTPRAYSVLQHSLLVFRLVKRAGGSPTQIKAALLHDATEAYVGDLNGTLKKHPLLDGYRQIESALARVIESRVGLPPNAFRDGMVKAADRLAFEFECAAIRDCESWRPPDLDELRGEFRREFFRLWPTSAVW